MTAGTTLVSVAFAPLVPWALIIAIATVAALMLLFGAAKRARGILLRALAIGTGLAALANPSIVQEQRQPLTDIVAIIADRSPSQNVSGRAARTDAALAAITAQFEAFENVEVRVIQPGAGGGAGGTRLFDAMEQALADVPPDRVAGTVFITDGQVHDVPEVAADAPGGGLRVGAGPVHVLLSGERGEGDRRLVIVRAPTYGVVGNELTLTVRIEDSAAAGPAAAAASLELTTDGERTERLVVEIGREVDIVLTLEHAGQTVVELATTPGPQELTLNNNRAAVVINGVRDRLRVMLISGEPHAGERTWRSLLKADPSVDLVHFTILRPPEKQDATPIRELSLIAFPIRQLFEEKIGDFDLIIFDRYRRRGVIPRLYMQNIADYVAAGGAVLEAAGPAFASPLSLYSTPLAVVLPSGPVGTVTTGGFRPQVSDLGSRHPVTADLSAGSAVADWGRWFRIIDADPFRGNILMEDERGAPLLILDRVGDGRVAQLLSDQAWLWARGFEGGGPQAELLRRLAHWLMKEPDLEEESLRAVGIGDRLEITRRSLTPEPPGPVTVTGPDGKTVQVALEPGPGGRAVGVMQVEASGLYRVNDGEISAIAAVGALNPLEFDDLRATDALLGPVAAATGGGTFWLAEAGTPEVRRVRAGRTATGQSWMGFPETGTYIVTGVNQASLMPALLVLLVLLGSLLASWYREGR